MELFPNIKHRNYFYSSRYDASEIISSIEKRIFNKHDNGIFFLFKRIYLQHLGQNNYNNIEIKITRAIKQDWTLTRLIDYLSTPAHATKRIK